MRHKALSDNEIDGILSATVSTDKATLLSYYDEQVQEQNERLHLRALLTAVRRRFIEPRVRIIEEARRKMEILKHGDFDDIQKHNALIPLIEKTQAQIDACAGLQNEPFFARMDLHSADGLEKYYIGKKGNHSLGIMDWRAPVAERYYQKSRLSFDVDGYDYRVVLRRSFKLSGGKWGGFRNEYLNLAEFLSEKERAGRDESLIYDPFLKELLASRKDSATLGDIIETIQEKQYAVICKPERQHIVVQGTAGSGKTMVLLHRLSYLMYNNRDIRPENVLVLTPSESFNGFIADLATTLELAKVNTSTHDAYYLSLLKSKIPQIERLSALEQAEQPSYLYKVYHGGGGKIQGVLQNLYEDVKDKLHGDDVVRAVATAEAERQRSMQPYQSLKNAPYQVRLSVLGEIKEKEDGSFLYTRNFRRLMTEGELALEGLYKLNGPFASEYRFALTLKATLQSLAFVKKYSSGEISGSVRSLRAKEAAILREIEGIRSSAASLVKYSKNKMLAAIEELKYRRQIEEREVALSAIRAAMDEVAVIADYFRALKAVYVSLSQQSELVSFAGLSDPSYAVKFVYNHFIAPFKPQKTLFSPSDLYLLVSALAALGHDFKQSQSFLFIDEGQDISADEYALLRKIHPKATFNVFGDVAQNVTPHRGITDWAESGIPATPDELNRNYRNTVQTVDYVAKKLGIEMLAVGPSGRRVQEGGDLTAFFRGVKGLKAVIYSGEYPEALRGRDFHAVAKDGRLVKNKINVMTVRESKGLEFTAVGVIERGMTLHEKYIAFTRALYKLAVWEEV